MKTRNPLKNKKGVTMTELIVTFALISIFVVLTGQVIASAMGIYHKIQSVEYGKQVSDTIMNKIIGELSGAQVVPLNSVDTTTAMRILKPEEDDSNSIEFCDHDGSRVKITSGTPKNYTYNDSADAESASSYPADNPANWGSQLIIHYYAVRSGVGETLRQPVDWTFDRNMYQGYHIEKLTFSRADYTEYPWNIIKVELKLASEVYGLYETTRYVDCYNFKNDTDKITENGNPVPATPTPAPLPTTEPTPNPATPNPATPTPTSSPTPTPSPTPTATPPAPDNGLDYKYFDVNLPNGDKRRVYDSGIWDALSEELKNNGLNGANVARGTIWIIGDKAYVIKEENQWIPKNELEGTVEELIKNHATWFVEIKYENKIFTKETDVKEEWNNKCWKDALPKQGELYWDGTDLWVAFADIAQNNDCPNNGWSWIKLTSSKIE